MSKYNRDLHLKKRRKKQEEMKQKSEIAASAKAKPQSS